MSAHACPCGITAYGARDHRNAGIHAGGHTGHRQRTHAARPGRRSRRADPARQYLSSLPAPRTRIHPPDGRIAQVHVLAQRDPHRFGRISGVQPERTAQDRRGRRGVQFSPERRPPRVHAGIHRGRATGLRQRHPDGARRVSRVPGEPRIRAAEHAAHGTLGGAGEPPFRAPHRRNPHAPRPVPHRAGLDVPGPAPRVRHRAGGSRYRWVRGRRPVGG